MTIGLVGRKCGMTRVFTEAGVSVPVTVVEVLANRVTQVKGEADGYRAVQVTYGKKRPQLLSKAVAGHYAKAKVEPGRSLVEFRLESTADGTRLHISESGFSALPDDARRLANYCASFPHQINLIPFNEHRVAEFRAPTEAVVDEFARAVLAERRTVLTVRRSRGRDVGAACGQLVLG